MALAFAVVVMSSCVADGVRTIPGNSPELPTGVRTNLTRNTRVHVVSF
jgi:hypothetical protein